MKKMNKKKTSENHGKKMTGKGGNGGLSLRMAVQVGKRRNELKNGGKGGSEKNGGVT